jgi:hypothetical protein
MAKDIEHFPFCTSFESSLYNSFVDLLIRLFALLVHNFLSSLCILDINPLSDE